MFDDDTRPRGVPTDIDRQQPRAAVKPPQQYQTMVDSAQVLPYYLLLYRMGVPGPRPAPPAGGRGCSAHAVAWRHVLTKPSSILILVTGRKG